MIEQTTLQQIHTMPGVGFHSTYYHPETCDVPLAYSCYELSDFLINALRLSNGLDFMPEAQRLALIGELSKPSPFIK